MGTRHPKITRFLLFALITLSACSGYKHRYQKSSIMMEKTPCFGTCPVYSITIIGNGNAVLNKKMFTPTTGEFTQKFDAKEINDLFKELASMEWENYKDEYETYVSDLPGTRVTFKHKNREKNIYIPGGAEIPSELGALIEELETYYNKGNWIGEVR